MAAGFIGKRDSRTVLITGGAGFVGSRLAMGVYGELSNVRVIALDNLKRRGSELNLPRLREAGVEFVHGDVRNPEDLDAIGDVGLIIECSAEPSVLAGYDTSPLYVVNTNLMGAINCLELARRRGADMIFLSTSRVYPYEELNALAFDETDTRFVLKDAQPVPGASASGISECFPLEGACSLYGATKICSEIMIREYVAMYGLRAIVNRCGVIAGPWQMGKIDQGVVVLWAARHVYEQSLDYIGFGGEGKQVRDILHVDDLLRLVLYEIAHMDELSGETLNVGGGLGVSVSLRELTALCEELTGNRIGIGSVPGDRPADVRVYVTDNSRVTELTGWRPKRGAREILEDICVWIRDYREDLRGILT